MLLEGTSVTNPSSSSIPDGSVFLVTLNAWENTLRHDCGLHIAHVHKNSCGSHDFPNQAFLTVRPFVSLLPLRFLLPSIYVTSYEN